MRTVGFAASWSEVWVSWGPLELAAGIWGQGNLVEDWALNLWGLCWLRMVCAWIVLKYMQFVEMEYCP